ncbi:hypothetical protein ACLAE7_005266, partial [Escherichia coli]
MDSDHIFILRDMMAFAHMCKMVVQLNNSRPYLAESCQGKGLTSAVVCSDGVGAWRPNLYGVP